METKNIFCSSMMHAAGSSSQPESDERREQHSQKSNTKTDEFFDRIAQQIRELQADLERIKHEAKKLRKQTQSR